MISERLKKELERTDYRATKLKWLASRNSPTKAEALLVERLPDFMFQQPLLDFIVDFLNPETSVCVEVDGRYHWNQYRKDRRRDLRLYKELDVCTIRVLNEDVIEDPDEVAEKVRDWSPIPPLEIDDRAIDGKKSHQLNHEFEELIGRWSARPRSQVVPDSDFLERFANEGFDYQSRFVRRLKKRSTYWPTDGYPKLESYGDQLERLTR